MNCLLVAATSREIGPFLTYFRDSQKNLHIDFSLDVLITGVGTLASTYQLTRHVAIRRPDLMIQAGVAGSFDKKIKPGSVMAIKQDRMADESVVENKKLLDLFDMKLGSANQFPYKKGWLANTIPGIFRRSGLKAVRSVSVNQITTSREMMGYYRKKYNPVLESMEGAAFHYVGLKENIPFLQVRAVSNYVGERDKKKWKMKEAITNLNNVLIRLLENL